MKKSFFLLGVAVAAMTSCSNDKLLDQAEPIQRAIGFDSFVNKGTKAVTETTSPYITNEDAIAGLNKFNVFGYYGNEVVFNNIPVTAGMDAQAIKWDYTNNDPTKLKYWTKNHYYFAAYANKNSSDNLPNVSFSNSTLLTFSDYTVNDEQDLIADVVNKDNSSYGVYANPVEFDFKHLLTKIQFTIKNTSKQYNMRIVSIDMTQNGAEANNSDLSSNGFTSNDANILGGLAIKGLINKGTCTVDVNKEISWTPSTTDATYRNFTPFIATNDANSETNSEAIFAKLTENSEANEKATTTYFVMPQNPSNVKFAIKAEFLDENDQVVTEKIVTGTLKAGITEETWMPGYSYNYIISLPTSALPIEFDVNEFDGFTQYVGGSLELNPENLTQGE